MPRKQLAFNSIRDLEPAVGAMFDDLLKQCVKDCQDRPRLLKNRSVKLEVVIAPEDDKNGVEVDGVLMQINVTKAIPKQVTRTFSLGVQRDGSLVFNDADPTTHHTQKTLDEAADEGKA